MEKMTLRRMCESFGVSRRAVQGYEKAGLVSPSGKNDRGHLLYDEDAQKRVEQIKMYQDFGFSLQEIGVLLKLPASALKERLEAKRSELLLRSHDLEKTVRIINEMIRSPEGTEADGR